MKQLIVEEYFMDGQINVHVSNHRSWIDQCLV